MKKIVVGFVLLMTSASFADLALIASPISGTRINGPGDLVQILFPEINLQASSPTTTMPLHYDNDTAAAVCNMVKANSSVIEIRPTTADIAKTLGVSFDSRGVINYYSPAQSTQDTLSFIACK